jgi:uncharacterized membrane protein
MSESPHSRRATSRSLLIAAAIVLSGTIALALHLHAILQEPNRAQGLIGIRLWQVVVGSLGGREALRGGVPVAEIPFSTLFLWMSVGSGLAWLGGGVWISHKRELPFRSAVCRWGGWGWMWWMLPLSWEIVAAAADLAGATTVQALLQALLPYLEGAVWAGWLTAFAAMARKPAASASGSNYPARIPTTVWGAMVLYFLCFAAMNWLLYAALLVPHGDSAMYEEHIWNLLHGKGFRSYLDNGRLFLGEHVQLIHLFLIPLYVLWPSHVLLELCQSAALALGAIPAYRIAHRHSGSSGGAGLLAAAYLLYFPMQYLDIAVTFKTFRPNSFEIPLLLFALDALERSRYRTLLAWLALALLCQEDAATVISPLGIWIALRQANFAGVADRAGRRRLAWFGLGMTLFGMLYLVLVLKVVLPWFRGGADVHFARYFSDLGATSGEIAANTARHPGRLLARFLNVESAMFALQLLLPLGCLPLVSPGRLAVGAPLFTILCLSEITSSPFHHFHAPLVPILVWAAAAGLGNTEVAVEVARGWWRRKHPAKFDESRRGRIRHEQFVSSGKTLPVEGTPRAAPGAHRLRHAGSSAGVVVTAAVWAAFSALFSGFFLGMTPLGIGFWSPESRAYWRNLYVPGERARHFPAAFALVPPESRVASTDYIHPRFTHHARSYDYSHYRPNVPDDADYIVIDTRHPYSEIRSPRDVKEYRDAPHEWELLNDGTEGYFIVLKRRSTPPTSRPANR